MRSPDELKESADKLVQGALAAARTLHKSVNKMVAESEMKKNHDERTDAFSGFFAGMGRSLMGNVMRPTERLLDFAVRTGEGFSHSASPMEFGGRVRAPRPKSRDGVLRIYDPVRARGLDALRGVCGGAYKNEFFVGYAALQGVDAVLITDLHVIVHEVCTLDKRFVIALSELAQVCVVQCVKTPPDSGRTLGWIATLIGSFTIGSFTITQQRLHCKDRTAAILS